MCIYVCTYYVNKRQHCPKFCCLGGNMEKCQCLYSLIHDHRYFKGATTTTEFKQRVLTMNELCSYLFNPALFLYLQTPNHKLSQSCGSLLLYIPKCVNVYISGTTDLLTSLPPLSQLRKSLSLSRFENVADGFPYFFPL